MNKLDLKISGGTVANSAETFTADVGIRDGKIVALGKSIGDADREIDASGKLILPGGIEAHCHIEQESSGGIMTFDDYYSGSVSAAYGGNTCFVPFAAQHRGQKLKDVLETYHHRAATKSVIDYSFHLIISDPTDEVLHEELPRAIEQGITSFKVYMTYDRLIVDDGQLLDILETAKKHGALTMVHAENNAMIKWISDKLVDSGHGAPKYHAPSHPRTAESEAINRAIALASFLDTPILIVHVSTEAMQDTRFLVRHARSTCSSMQSRWTSRICTVRNSAAARRCGTERHRKRSGVVCKTARSRFIRQIMRRINLMTAVSCTPDRNRTSKK